MPFVERAESELPFYGQAVVMLFIHLFILPKPHSYGFPAFLLQETDCDQDLLEKEFN